MVANGNSRTCEAQVGLSGKGVHEVDGFVSSEFSEWLCLNKVKGD